MGGNTGKLLSRRLSLSCDFETTAASRARFHWFGHVRLVIRGQRALPVFRARIRGQRDGADPLTLLQFSARTSRIRL